MEITTLRSWIARLLELASVACVMLAVLAGMLMGSGISVTSRGVVQGLALLALLATILSMAAAGKWRLIRSWFWIVPILLLCLAFLQILLTPTSPTGLSDEVIDPSLVIRGYTASPFATAEWLLWGTAATLICAVTAHQLHGDRRVDVFFLVLGTVLVASAALGIFRTSLTGAPTAAATSAIGPASYRSWNQSEIPAGDTDGDSWFTPGTLSTVSPSFAGFLTSMHFGACVVAIVPVLLAIGIRRFTISRQVENRQWLGMPSGRLAIGASLLAILLTTLTCLFTPSAALAFGLGVGIAASLLLLQNPVPQKSFLAAAGGVVPLVIVLMTPFDVTGEGQGLWSNVSQAIVDNRSLLSILQSYPLFGCGLGSLGEVWSWHRSDAADIPPLASSLLALVCEAGLFGSFLFLAAAAYLGWRYVKARALFQRAYVNPDGLLLPTAYLASLLATVTVGLLGPGLEAPAVLLVAAVNCGLLIRAISVKDQPSEGEVRG